MRPAEPLIARAAPPASGDDTRGLLPPTSAAAADAEGVEACGGGEGAWRQQVDDGEEACRRARRRELGAFEAGAARSSTRTSRRLPSDVNGATSELDTHCPRLCGGSGGVTTAAEPSDQRLHPPIRRGRTRKMHPGGGQRSCNASELPAVASRGAGSGSHCAAVSIFACAHAAQLRHAHHEHTSSISRASPWHHSSHFVTVASPSRATRTAAQAAGGGGGGVATARRVSRVPAAASAAGRRRRRRRRQGRRGGTGGSAGAAAARPAATRVGRRRPRRRLRRWRWRRRRKRRRRRPGSRIGGAEERPWCRIAPGSSSPRCRSRHTPRRRRGAASTSSGSTLRSRDRHRPTIPSGRCRRCPRRRRRRRPRASSKSSSMRAAALEIEMGAARRRALGRGSESRLQPTSSARRLHVAHRRPARAPAVRQPEPAAEGAALADARARRVGHRPSRRGGAPQSWSRRTLRPPRALTGTAEVTRAEDADACRRSAKASGHSTDASPRTHTAAAPRRSHSPATASAIGRQRDAPPIEAQRAPPQRRRRGRCGATRRGAAGDAVGGRRRRAAHRVLILQPPPAAAKADDRGSRRGNVDGGRGAAGFEVSRPRPGRSSYW